MILLDLRLKPFVKYTHGVRAEFSRGKPLEIGLYNQKQPLSRLLFRYERVSGIEPPSQPWEGHIITTIRYPPDYLAFGVTQKPKYLPLIKCI